MICFWLQITRRLFARKLFSSVNKIPRKCRVLRSFEPANAGGSLPGSSALAQAYRVASERWKTRLLVIGSKPRVQHHEHSRVSVLYHLLKLKE